jgi:hypothetical protein
MSSQSEARAIREAFGMFWRKNSHRQRPEELKGLTITNARTFPTQVRVKLLKELCRRHQVANPNLSCFVTNYLARPELKIHDKKGHMVSLNYTQAVLKLSHHLTLKFLRGLCQFAMTNLPEDELTDRFIILSPDLLNPTPDLANSSSVSTDDFQLPLLAPTGTSVPPTIPSNPIEHPPTSTPQSGSGTFTVVSKKQKPCFLNFAKPN